MFLKPHGQLYRAYDRQPYIPGLLPESSFPPRNSLGFAAHSLARASTHSNYGGGIAVNPRANYPSLYPPESAHSFVGTQGSQPDSLSEFGLLQLPLNPGQTAIQNSPHAGFSPRTLFRTQYRDLIHPRPMYHTYGTRGLGETKSAFPPLHWLTRRSYGSNDWNNHQ